MQYNRNKNTNMNSSSIFLSILLALFLFQSHAQTSPGQLSASDFGPEDIPPSLTLSTFLTILHTESPDEISSTNPQASEKLWQKSIRYEWSRAVDAEQSRGTKFPFLICNGNPQKSGVQRRKELRDAAFLVGGGEPRMMTVANQAPRTCFLSTLHATVAAKISSEFKSGEITVQPLTHAMKLSVGSVSDARFEYGAHPRVLEMSLCPEIMDGVVGGGISESDMKETVVESLMERDFFNGKSFAGEFFFWSVMAEDETSRGAFWRDMLSNGIDSDSGVCNDLHDFLLFEFETGDEGELTLMSIDFDRITGKALREECILSLMVSLTLLPEVCSIRARQEVLPLNANAQWIVQSRFGEKPGFPWYKAGIKGEGQVVAVSDTGIDLDNCYFWDNSVAGKLFSKGKRNIDLEQRKVVQYDPFVDGLDKNYGHGTHVAGTISGKRATLGTGTSQGRADGVAENSKIAFIDIGRMDGTLHLPSTRRLYGTGRPYAKIHSAAWGSTYNAYGKNAIAVDSYMYRNDDFLVVIAAGNDGIGNSKMTVGDPATAKNAIAVGATHSVGTDLREGQKGPNYMASFSSQGPTLDGRTKPDIVAPGSHILSAGSRASLKGECDPTDGSIPIPGQQSEGLLSLQGTSMSSAVVSGSAALVRQYFEEGFYPTGDRDPSHSYSPSGYLIKAILMNGAQYTTGVDNGALGTTPVTPYDNIQNFGRVSLLDSLYLNKDIQGVRNVKATIWDRRVIQDGKTHTKEIRIKESPQCEGMPLRATLVWNDPPAMSGCASCLLNDLDLFVTLQSDESIIHYPNGRSKKDSVNNVERVEIEGTEEGNVYRVHVNAFNLITKSQAYALVVTGCTETFDDDTNPDGNLRISQTVERMDQNSIILISCLSVVASLGFCCVCFACFMEFRRRNF